MNNGALKRPSVILIGPMHAGKSTVAKLLAERWGVRRVCMDHVRFEYYREIGYEQARAEALHKSGGFAAMVAYWKPFEAHAVERLLADVAGERCVIDFGAGHSVYEDPALFARVQAALAPYPVVLLLPSPDPQESIEILRRRRDEAHPEMRGSPTDVNEHFVRHPSNRLLAKFTVYTRDHTPDQTADEVARYMNDAT
jgi:shikimate kinase